MAYYPAWETLPHERLSPRSDTVGRRLELLRRLAGNSELPAPQIVVAPVRSVLQPQVKGLGKLTTIRLTVGEDIDLTDLAAALVGAAYTRVDLVERRGEFAVRGGIVDVFPPTEEHPVRVDFFGDTIEEIHYFSVADQRSSDIALTEITASPCRELLLTDEVRARAAALAEQHPELIEMLDKIAQGHPVDGMEALSPVLVDGMELLIDLLPTDTHVLICDPELVRGRAIELVKTSEEFLHASWAAAAGGGKAPIDLGASPISRSPRFVLRPSPEEWRGGRCRHSAPVRSTILRLAPRRAQGAVRPSTNPSGPRTARSSIFRTESAAAAWNRERCSARSVRPIGGTPRQRSTRSPSGSVRRGAWSSWPKAEVLQTGSPKLLSEHELPVRILSSLEDPPPQAWPQSSPGQLSHGFLADTFGSPSSPHPIYPASG